MLDGSAGLTATAYSLRASFCWLVVTRRLGPGVIEYVVANMLRLGGGIDRPSANFYADILHVIWVMGRLCSTSRVRGMQMDAVDAAAW